MKKLYINFITIVIVLSMSLTALADSKYKVSHKEIGSWNASYIISVKSGKIKSVDDINIHVALGSIVKRNVNINESSVILKITRKIGILIFNTGLKTIILNEKPKTRVI